MLQNNPKLQGLINELWKQFWSGGISNPITAIEQINYLLFIKRLDQLESTRENSTRKGTKQELRFAGTYIPYVDEAKFLDGAKTEDEIAAARKKIDAERKERLAEELRWSRFIDFAPQKMLNHVRFNVFPFLKRMNNNSSPYTRHMSNAVFMIEKPSLLANAVKKIEAIFVEMAVDADEGGHSFQDIQGDVYEMLLNEIATSGKNGQFRTPRHIIKLMAELTQPQLGELICDPACGTGGFLLGAYQYMLTDIVKSKYKERLRIDEDGFERGTPPAGMTERENLALDNRFVGYDIDASMVRLGTMNLMMHGIDNPQINYGDTLSRSFGEENTYDLILANPPFTGNIDKGDINENLKLPTTKTELLFIERIYRMLKKGKRAAIIIPQGVLFGGGKAFVEARKILTERCRLEAVISMPSGIFKPYAGVSTAILVFTKEYNAEKVVQKPATDTVWFYNMEGDGYSLTDKRTRISNDFGDLQEIVAGYNTRNKENNADRTAKHFLVSFEEIKDKNYDLSFSKYSLPVYEAIEVKDPKKLFVKLTELENNIQQELKNLEDMMA